MTPQQCDLLTPREWLIACYLMAEGMDIQRMEIHHISEVMKKVNWDEKPKQRGQSAKKAVKELISNHPKK
jgi:hypothetical protein